MNKNKFKKLISNKIFIAFAALLLILTVLILYREIVLSKEEKINKMIDSKEYIIVYNKSEGFNMRHNFTVFIFQDGKVIYDGYFNSSKKQSGYKKFIYSISNDDLQEIKNKFYELNFFSETETGEPSGYPPTDIGSTLLRAKFDGNERRVYVNGDFLSSDLIILEEFIYKKLNVEQILKKLVE